MLWRAVCYRFRVSKRTLMTQILTAMILAVAACGRAPVSPVVARRPAPTCAHRDGEIGDRSLLTVSSELISGLPQTCAISSPDEAYVMVRGAGTRKFSTDSGCKALPPLLGAPADVCPEIDIRYFLHATMQKLRSHVGREGADAFSWGKTKFDRAGLIVHHWKYANDAVMFLSKELRAWGIGESVDLSVEEIACAVDLAPQRPPSPGASVTEGHGCRWACKARGACSLVCDVPDPRQCGDRHCGEDEECCNASCGVCVARGGYCFSDDCLRGVLKSGVPGLNH